MPSSFTVTADVKLNPQSLTQSASQVKQALGRITGQASEFQKSLDASTARVFAFGATTVVLNSVSQAFRKLVSSTIEVEKRMVEINAIFQQTEGVMNNFRETIFDVAQQTGQSFETVAEAAGELARQGLTAEETATRLQAALILTRISGLGAEDSVKTLTAAINGFTSAALDAEEVTNKIVAVDTAFAVSAQDLAQGLARAGSTAEDAGVSFDQLLGLITAVEQRTARGGAVIGNAFKSIFTRLSRGSTIDDLQALGVEIDATQTGVQKLQALSEAIEGIGDPTVVSKIKELAGGVFQINVVSAALKDLTSETSVFKKATVEAANASDDAYKRNEDLNKSLAAQINSLVQGVTNLASKIGTLTFGPLLTNLISIAGKITEVFNNALDPEKGNAFIKAFIKGIGTFISGPGLVIITAAFLKIVGLVAKFAADGFKAVLKIGSASEKISQIEGGIVGLLSRDKDLRKIIASTTATQAQKEEAVINAIKRENQLLREQKALLSSLTAAAARRGVSGFDPASGFAGGRRRRFAEGYVPNYARSSDFALEKQEAISLGATKSVKAIKGKGTIGGRSFIMNDQETEIPNFGRNGDSAVIPSYARGYVPNYADAKPFFNETRYVSYGKIKGTQPSKLFTEKNSAKNYPFLSQSLKNTYNELVDGAGPLIRSKFTKWKNGINEKSVSLKDDLKTPNPTILVPQGKSGGILATSKNAGEGFKKVDFGFPIIGIQEKVKEGLGKDFEAKFNPDEIEANAREDAVNQANSITRILGDPPVKEAQIRDPEGFTGAIRAAAGAVFDAAVTKALQLKASKKGEGADFDVRVGGNENLKRLFSGEPTPTEGALKGLGDFKYSSSAQKSMKAKTLKELRLKHKDIYDELRFEKAAPPKKNVLANDPTDPNPKDKAKKKTAKKKTPIVRARRASGYIPNFAAGGILGDLLRGKETTDLAGGGALGDAIKREKAAGLPESQIRVEQSQKLVNRDNPTGLAVTNTRDEPRGLKDVFASGYVPNFAQKKESTFDKFKKKSIVDSETKLLYGLKDRVTNVESDVKILKNISDNETSNRRITKDNFASGYISNFAGGGALGDAIQREKDAGLPKSKIRVERSKRLINRDNPSGLAVTNTIDEPRGLRDVFAQGRGKEKQGFAKGYVPNFAAAAAARNVTGFLTKNTKSLSKETASLNKETDGARKAMNLFGGSILAGSAVSYASGRVTESADRVREAEIEAISKSVEARKKETNERNDLTQSEKEVIIKSIDDDASAKTKEVSEGKTTAESVLSYAGLAANALIFKDQIASAGKGIGRFGKETKKRADQIKRLGKKGILPSGKAIRPTTTSSSLPSRFAGKVATDSKKTVGKKLAKKTVEKASGGFVRKAAVQVGSRLVGLVTGIFGSIVGAGAVGAAIGTALDKADLNPIQRFVEGGSQKEVAKREKVESRNKNFERSTEVIPARLETILAKAFPEQGSLIREERKDDIRRINENTSLTDRGKKREVEFIKQAANPEGIITELRKTLPKREFDYLKSAAAEYAAALENAAQKEKEGLDGDGSVIRNNADKTFDAKIKVVKGGGEAKILKKYTALIGQQVSIQQAINLITKRRAETENQILSSQIKENLIRKNIIKTLSRSKSLLPKDILAAGGGSIVDADISTIKNQDAKSKADKLGAKAQNLTAQFSSKREELERSSPKIKRLNELKQKEAGGEELTDGEVKEKESLGKQISSITGELDALREAKDQAVIDFTIATDEYNNSVLDGARDIRLGLKSIAEKIKSDGSQAMIRAFEEFEALAENPDEVDPSKYKSAADSFFKALEEEVKKQYATNAVAAGNFYSKIVKDLQNPVQAGKDIETSVAGLQAINSDDVSTQEKINILAEIQPLLKQIGGERGADSAQLQEVLKAAFGSKDRESAAATFKKITEELSRATIANRVGSTNDINNGAIEDRNFLAEKNKPEDPEGFDKRQRELFDSYDKLTGKLKLYEKQFESAKSVKTATDELILAIESASSTVKILESGFSAAGSFGEKANKAIEASQGNIEDLVETASEMTTNLQNLSEREKNIASAITAVQAVVNTILTTRGAGGGAE